MDCAGLGWGHVLAACVPELVQPMASAQRVGEAMLTPLRLRGVGSGEASAKGLARGAFPVVGVLNLFMLWRPCRPGREAGAAHLRHLPRKQPCEMVSENNFGISSQEKRQENRLRTEPQNSNDYSQEVTTNQRNRQQPLAILQRAY